MVLSRLKVLISWSHSNPGWDDSERDARTREVRHLADQLRAAGIDADVDLYHKNEGVDWSRWGPKLVRDVDRVLVVVSPAWRAAWEGRGNPNSGAGAAAEADALKSLYSRDRREFIERVRLVLLPSEPGEQHIPDGLHGITRYALPSIDADGLAELLRDLTAQQRYPRPPLGPVPALPPEPVQRKASYPAVKNLPFSDSLRKRGLAGAIAVIAALAVWLFAGTERSPGSDPKIPETSNSGQAPSPDRDTAPESTPSLATEDPPLRRTQIERSASAGQFDVVVHAMTCGSRQDPRRFSNERLKGELCFLSVTVANRGTATERVSVGSWNLKVGDLQYDWSWSEGAAFNRLFPGTSGDGVIGFDVPIGSAPTSVTIVGEFLSRPVDLAL